MDHHADGTAYQRFNKKLAVQITSKVGTMTAAYVFACLSFSALPATLHLVSPKTFGFFPGWLTGTSMIALVAWVAAYFLQLVLLPIIMVGQNVQGAASDARAAKTFDDTEYIKDQVNEHTDGGVKTILDAIESLRSPA